jgi:site-specific recombinase XerD
MKLVINDKRTRASPTINKPIKYFEMSNLADGKSERTITWYRDILTLFLRYLKGQKHIDNIEEFNIENVRNYILYLRGRNKFGKYSNINQRHPRLSPQTIRGHIRGLKALGVKPKSAYRYYQCWKKTQGNNNQP